MEPARLLGLLRLLSANQSGELVRARLARQASIPESTVTGYLDLLQTLFLVSVVPPWTANLTQREVSRPKAHVTDSALAMRLAWLSEARLLPLTGSEHLGGLLEATTTSELLKQATWSAQDFRLFHFRDRNGLEVDLIIELEDGRVLGVEVKSARSAMASHFAGLAEMGRRLGDRWAGGIVLNTAEAGHQHASRLWSLPLSALWEW